MFQKPSVIRTVYENEEGRGRGEGGNDGVSRVPVGKLLSYITKKTS